MGFRDEFLLSMKTYAEWDQARLTMDSSHANLDRLKAIQSTVKSTFERGVDRIAKSQMVAASVLQAELSYQAEKLSRAVVGAINESADAVVGAIQHTSDYLGSHLCDIRWAIERHTEVSRQHLEVLLNSLGNESRQFYEQGVKCYEAKEYGLAKERFNRALASSITNYFAYQYLGFIAVQEDNAQEAIRNFDLARKFAESNRYKALAFSHMARSYRALGELDLAVDSSKAAVDIDPGRASYWYELTSYCARLGRSEMAIESLKRAIHTDWTYWSVAIVDVDLDSIRAQVNHLLNELRQIEKAKAIAAVKQVESAVDLAREIGVEQQLGPMISGVGKLNRKLQQENVYGYREIPAEAEQLQNSVLGIATSFVAIQMNVLRTDLQNHQVAKDKQVQGLNEEIQSIRAGYEPLPKGCFVYGIIGLFAIVVELFIVDTMDMDSVPLIVISFAVIYATLLSIPSILDKLQKWETEGIARRTEKKVAPRIKELGKEFEALKKNLDAELDKWEYFSRRVSQQRGR